MDRKPPGRTSHPGYRAYPRLLREETIGRVRQVCSMGTSYILMAKGLGLSCAVTYLGCRLVITTKIVIKAGGLIGFHVPAGHGHL